MKTKISPDSTYDTSAGGVIEYEPLPEKQVTWSAAYVERCVKESCRAITKNDSCTADDLPAVLSRCTCRSLRARRGRARST